MKAIVIAATLGVAAAPAAAAEWRFFEEDGRSVLAVDGGNLAFRCQGGSEMVAAIALDGDVLSALSVDTRRVKELSADVVVGENAYEERLAYLPNAKLVFATRGMAKKMFNAAIRGDAISVDVGRRGAAEIAPPAADAASFNAFKDACVK
ncbi:MAG: hypothetical protein AAFR11_13270 [Pseudomonadota bacterium]